MNPEDRSGIVVTRDELIALGHVQRRRVLPGRRVTTPLAGAHVSRLHGPGMAFSEVRPYTPGDDVRSIDWRVTARTGSVHSKIFEAERERPMLLAVDLGASMRFATRGVFKSVLAARAASLLAWDAFEAGERVGAIVWSPGVCVELPAGRTRRHLMRLLGALADGTQVFREDVEEVEMAHRLAWLRDQARTGSRVAIASDFYALDDAALGSLRALSRRCELQLVWIHDALEAEAPPAGRYRVGDGERSELLVARSDEGWRRAYERDFRDRRERLARLARETGARLTRLPTDASPGLVLHERRHAHRRGRA